MIYTHFPLTDCPAIACDLQAFPCIFLTDFLRLQYHFHPQLSPGDNTLNLHIVRILLRTIAEAGAADSAAFMENYEDFMLTPGSHNDSWADNCLKMQFQRYADGGGTKQLAECAIDEKLVWNVNNTSPFLRSLLVTVLQLAKGSGASDAVVSTMRLRLFRANAV